ncbi:hypothetical protein NLU13_8150 [Sarocladium strictum]|uniref:Guanylate kinase-like domain-containing protein n=1 Tax=Sarocladium strictum TaxID=5046 RepID=A0AA39L4D2_SARSR|nr:hypothetical protein NLU13_8150 [Sarocladium strictum]
MTSIMIIPPHDIRPLVLCGFSVLEKHALLSALQDLCPDSFTVVKRHNTAPSVGHDPFYYMSNEKFTNSVSDGDFATYTLSRECSSGILKQTISAATSAGRIAVVPRADVRAIRQLASWEELDARYVYIMPPHPYVAEARWTPGYVEPGIVQIWDELRDSLAELRRPPLSMSIRREQKAELEDAMANPRFFDLVLPTNDLDAAFSSLVSLVWG